MQFYNIFVFMKFFNFEFEKMSTYLKILRKSSNLFPPIVLKLDGSCLSDFNPHTFLYKARIKMLNLVFFFCNI